MENLIENINNFEFNVEYTTPGYNPFRYTVIDNFLKTSYYDKILEESKLLESEKRFKKFNVSYAPENQSKWKMCHLGCMTQRDSSFHLFSTQSFKKFISNIFSDIELTNNITMELHKHPINDADGWIHNDFDQANFVDDDTSKINGLNVWNHNSNYRQVGNLPDNYQKNARAIALIYYINPDSINWKEGDGGETAFYISNLDNVNNSVRKINPIPNRLVAYEINPYSWHAIKMKNKYERLSFHMWYHSDLEYSIDKWWDVGHTPMDR